MPENPLCVGVFCENCWTRLDDHAMSGDVLLRDCPLCGPREGDAS